MARILKCSFIITVFMVLLPAAIYAKEIKIPLYAKQISLDPTAVQDQSSLWVSRQMNCQLVRSVKGSIFKEAAAKITYDGPLKIIFELDPDIKFHDGSRITSDDVIASFEYLRESREVLRSIFDWVKGIEKISDTSLMFVLEKPIPHLLDFLATPYYSISKQEFLEKAKKDKGLWQKPIGCGNYKISEYDPNGKYLKLSPIREGLPITFYFSENNQIDAKDLDKYDIVVPEIVGKPKDEDKFRVEKIFDPYHIFMGFNISKERWSNRDKRCKLFTKFQPELVINEYGDVAEYANDIIPRGILGYSKLANYRKEVEDIAKNSSYNFEDKDEPVCLAFLSVSIPKKYREAYKKMVSAVFPNIETKIIEDPKYYGRTFQKTDCDVLILGLKADTLDAYDYLLIHSEEPANIFGKQDDNIINEIRESLNIGDKNYRGYVYQDIATKIRQKCLVFPILTIPLKEVYVRNALKTPGFGAVPLNEYYLGKVR